jgi:CheY-like chemotaxis protein
MGVRLRKLRRILLIDDSKADNFIHRRRIEKMAIAADIVVKANGREGLDYLTTPLPDGRYPNPDILFLDINMPLLDGWGFLDRYQHLPPEQRARVTVVLLTSSISDRDFARADTYPVIDEKMSKPLEQGTLHLLASRYFAD